MKLLHIADLHLGKRVCEYPMLEDQKQVLSQIVDMAKQQEVDAVLIAGDVYDRPVPPQEATALLSDFLCRLAAIPVKVLMIAGNHDSAERLSFCSALLAGQGVFVAGQPEDGIETVMLMQEGLRVAVHMISYTRPVALRPLLGEDITTSEQAMRALISRLDLTAADRNVLLVHAFVQGGETSESEQVTLGTVDGIPAAVLEGFDYVALGHLHKPQSICKHVRYAGSPLCYSFSEIGVPKSVTLIELGEEVFVRTLPLYPPHPMREVRGGMAELMQLSYSEDYIRAVVTDEDVPPDVRISLRTVFPNLMRFAVENSKTAYEESVGETESVSGKDPLLLFSEFYEQQNGIAPDEARLAVMRELLREGEESV